jgi:hypothetical protein
MLYREELLVNADSQQINTHSLQQQQQWIKGCVMYWVWELNDNESEGYWWIIQELGFIMYSKGAKYCSGLLESGSRALIIIVVVIFDEAAAVNADNWRDHS